MAGVSRFTNGPSSWPEAMERGSANSATKSRAIRRPKQFCAFVGGRSLLAHTRERLQPLFLDENTVFVLNQAHRMYYWRELSDVPWIRKLVQPLNRGTAPAIALAVLEILQRDPEGTIAPFSIGPSLPRILYFYCRSGVAVGEELRRPSLDCRSSCHLPGSGVWMDSTRPQGRPISVEFTPVCLAVLGKAESRGGPSFAEKRLFVEYLRHDRVGRRFPGTACGNRSRPAGRGQQRAFSNRPRPDLSRNRTD
jgi:hypothetical protein